jgi:hypothetical protein
MNKIKSIIKKIEIKIIPFMLNLLFKRSFTFNKDSYKYFYHSFNATYCNERMVEIPIIKKIIKNNKNKKILEIGNVLSNYYNIKHDILDKYDESKLIKFKEDIDTFKPKEKYDIIISISTLEHVGYDQEHFKKEGKDNKKILNTLKNIINNLVKELFIFTVPLGFNPILDNYILNNTLTNKYNIQFYFLKRDKKLQWTEIKIDKLKSPIKYLDKILAIGIYKK